MERFGGGLKKGGGAAVVTFKPGVISAKGKFKLRTSRDPLPLVTKKQPSRETKPKEKFLTVAGAGASSETQNNAKRSIIATNSFIQPLTKDGAPPRKSSGVNFMKFQSKSRDSGESTGKSSMNATPLAQTGMKPFVGKLFAQPFSKKIICTTRNANKETLFKPHEKKEELFSFRADTKSSVAKKRKATDSIAQRDGKTAFSCKNGRGKSSLLENPVTNKDKEKQAGVQAENAGRKDSIRSTVPFAIRMGERSKKVDDGAVLKKRGLLVASTIAGPPLKKSKRVPPSAAVHPLQNTGVIESGDRDHNVSLPSTCMLNPKETALEFADEPANSVLSCAEAPLSPGKCGIEEELALKLVCTAEDDKEDEFLARAAAIQEFTDRVGLEQKQLCNRLLDAHADVSESLLDALTDLMAEEGGIGIDKLDFDLNIDVDVGDAFLQDDEIQVF